MTTAYSQLIYLRAQNNMKHISPFRFRMLPSDLQINSCALFSLSIPMCGNLASSHCLFSMQYCVSLNPSFCWHRYGIFYPLLWSIVYGMIDANTSHAWDIQYIIRWNLFFIFDPTLICYIMMFQFIIIPIDSHLNG